jgi:hypothetical protein
MLNGSFIINEFGFLHSKAAVLDLAVKPILYLVGQLTLYLFGAK